MSDSKLNKKFHDAVRTGSRGAARKIRSSLKNMRMWQKVGLVLCVLFWIASVILGIVCRRITGSLVDQNAAQRWTTDESYAQISCFLAEGSGASEDTVKAMYSGLMTDLQQASIALSDTQTENGARLIEDCYSGMGSAEITSSNDSVTVNVIGVGGDFFNFHPLEMLDGYYFSDDDLMHDRVLLDDQTAWRLFGSPNVVGMQVTIGGTPHYIAGVFRQPRERFYSDSGIGSYLVYMSYDSLCKYTEAATAAGESTDDGSGSDGDMNVTEGMDAFVPMEDSVSGRRASALPASAEEPEGSAGSAVSVGSAGSAGAAEAAGSAQEPAIPQTAAYMPSCSEDLPGKKGTVYESEDMSGTEMETDTDTDTDDSEDPGLIEEKEETSATQEKEEETLSDAPIGGSLGKPDSDDGMDLDDSDQQETVNRSRVTCYEVVIPSPVKGFALRAVRSRLEQVPFSLENATVVDNTARYEILRLVTLIAQPGVRSMQTAPIRYPYWENVALAWEDVLIPYALLWMFLRYSPLLFLLWLLLWYATHKSWTLGGIVKDMQDRIYDKQSERIYGKKEETALNASEIGAIAMADPESGTVSSDELTEGSAEPDEDSPESAAEETGPLEESSPDSSAQDRDPAEEDSPESSTEETGSLEESSADSSAQDSDPAEEDSPENAAEDDVKKGE